MRIVIEINLKDDVGLDQNKECSEIITQALTKVEDLGLDFVKDEGPFLLWSHRGDFALAYGSFRVE